MSYEAKMTKIVEAGKKPIGFLWDLNKMAKEADKEIGELTKMFWKRGVDIEGLNAEIVRLRGLVEKGYEEGVEAGFDRSDFSSFDISDVKKEMGE